MVACAADEIVVLVGATVAPVGAVVAPVLATAALENPILAVVDAIVAFVVATVAAFDVTVAASTAAAVVAVEARWPTESHDINTNAINATQIINIYDIIAVRRDIKSKHRRKIS